MYNEILFTFCSQKCYNEAFKDIEKAKEINDMLMPLHKSLFIESNPSPVKYAASLLNLSSDEVRLPLVRLTDKTKKEVEKALRFAKLL